MDKLPYEIRTRIFWSLPFRNKCQCLLVSKDWNKWVKSSFYSDISIRKNSNLDEAMDFFYKNEELAQFVKYVKIDYCNNIYLYCNEFQQLFPNLKKLILRPYYFINRLPIQPRKSIEPGSFSYLKELMTVEPQKPDIPLIAAEVLKNNCPRLIEISSAISGPDDEPVAPNRYLRLFYLLTNAPNLSKLVLSPFRCDISELEILHKHAPNLKSVIFFYAKITATTASVYDSSAVTAKYEPAFLESLKVHFWGKSVGNGGEDDILSFFLYIGKKYAGLRVLALTAETSNDLFRQYNHGLPVIEVSLLYVIERSPKLVEYDMMFCPLTNKIVEEMDTCGIQLEKLTLYLEEDRLESQLSALFSSQQHRFIKHLSVTTTDDSSLFSDEEDNEDGSEQNDINRSVVMKALGKIAQMQQLEKVVITSNMAPLSLAILINYLNQMSFLKSISICNVAITYREKFPKLEIPLNVEKMEISMLEIVDLEYVPSLNKAIYNLLSCSPQLKHLVMRISINEYYDSIELANEFNLNEEHSMILDFRSLKNLKSIDVYVQGASNIFKIHKRDSTASGFYLHDKMIDYLIDRGNSCSERYFTTIRLPQQHILLNSIQI